MNTGTRVTAVAAFFISLTAPLSIAQPVEADRYPTEKWVPFGTFPTGVEVAMLYGNPAKPGLVVARLKYPANYRLPAHSHSIDYIITVISGTYYSGIGDRADPASMKAVGPGGTVLEPAGVAHYAETRGEPVVVQATGIGPGSTLFVNPSEDPRKK